MIRFAAAGDLYDEPHGTGMTATRIVRWDAGKDGPLSETTLERKIHALGFEVEARTYPAGIAQDARPQGVDTITAVLQGLVKLTVDGEPSMLTAGDIAVIPRQAVRRVEAVGPSTALCLEAQPSREPRGPGQPGH
jgi:mannose-6-phosphate isomerase-like protein (cupin superfamily)